MTGTPAQRLALLRTPCDGLCAPDPAEQRWVTAFLQRGRQIQITNPAANHPPTISLTAGTWSWPVFQAVPSTPQVAFWPAPAHWWSPAYYETIWPSPQAIRSRHLVRRDPSWQRPVGEDGGMLIDDIQGGSSHGWEILNSRPAQAWDLFLINIALWQNGSPVSAQPGDIIADGFGYRTPANAGHYLGRGCGRLPKRDVLTAAELDGGITTRLSALPYVSANPRWRQTAGPVLPEGIGFVDPATRVEHDGWATFPYPSTPNPPGNHLFSTPHGWRWRLDPRIFTDAFIAAKAAAWHPAHAGRRHAATQLMKILRHWGAYQAESGSGDPTLETSNGPTGSDFTHWTVGHGITEANTGTFVSSLLLPVAGKVPIVNVGRIPI